MALDFIDLVDRVTNVQTIEGSVDLLLTSVDAELQSIADNPNDVRELARDLNLYKSKLSSAVAQNVSR